MVGTTIDRSAVLPASIRPLVSMGYIKPLPAPSEPDSTAYEDEGGTILVERGERADIESTPTETPFGERKRGNRKRG